MKHDFDLLPRDEYFVKGLSDECYAMACAMKMESVTRELSLFVLMQEEPSIIEELEENNIEGRQLYKEMFFQFQTYEQLGAPQKPKYLLNEYDNEEWKINAKEPKHDVHFLSQLKASLHDMKEAYESEPEIDLNQLRKNVLYDCFVDGALETKEFKEPSTSNQSLHNVMEEDHQMDRTYLMGKYLFAEEGLLEQEKPKDLTIKEKILKSFGKNKLFSSGKILNYLLISALVSSLYQCADFGHNKKDIVAKSDTTLRRPANDGVQITLPRDMLQDTTQLKILHQLLHP